MEVESINKTYDHLFFRQGVKFYLSSLEDFESVGECSSGEEAISEPDVVLMDLKMTGKDGIFTTEALLRFNPNQITLLL